MEIITKKMSLSLRVALGTILMVSSIHASDYVEYFSSVVSDIYHWNTPDNTFPTLDQLNTVTFSPLTLAQEQKNSSTEEALKILSCKTGGTLVINGTTYSVEPGIPGSIKENSDQPISVYSGGYSNDCKPYAFCGYTAIKAGLVPGKCVTFDFATDTRRGFNFCQNQDMHCLKTVCNAIVNKNPDAKLILHGACKGAANNLKFLATQAEEDEKEPCMNNIKAVIAESPPISVSKALEEQYGSFITIPLLPYIFPNYDPQAKTIMDMTAFPSIPLLVASLPNDTISKLADIQKMNNHLITQGAVIEHFISKQTEIRHGRIGQAEDYRDAVKAFLKKQGLTWDYSQ